MHDKNLVEKYPSAPQVPGGLQNLRPHGLYRVVDSKGNVDYKPLEMSNASRKALYEEAITDGCVDSQQVMKTAYPELSPDLLFLFSCFIRAPLPIPFFMHFFRLGQRVHRFIIRSDDELKLLIFAFLETAVCLYPSVENYKILAKMSSFPQGMTPPEDRNAMLVQFYLPTKEEPITITRHFGVDLFATKIAKILMPSDDISFFASCIDKNGVPDVKRMSTFFTVLKCSKCTGVYVDCRYCAYDSRGEFFRSQVVELRENGIKFCECSKESEEDMRVML